MYKQDLALNNPQGLICHKVKPTNHLMITLHWKSERERHNKTGK